MKRLILLLLVLLLVIPSSALLAQEEAEEVEELDILVDTEWVLENLDNENVRLVDVSGSLESFEEGHLPGAVFLDWREDLVDGESAVPGQIAPAEQIAEALAERGISNDTVIVLYDDTSNLFAARAYWVLKYYQHENVVVYNGGTRKWEAEGESLTTDAVEVDAAEYEIGEADPALRTTGEYVLENLDNTDVQFCDTRSPEEYIGTDVRADRGGHIPGAINLEWNNSVNSDGTFKSFEELDELFTLAGFDREKEIITYCQTGVRGAHTWFVLSVVLGYENVRNYDGSWVEYGNNAEAPIDN